MKERSSVSSNKFIFCMLFVFTWFNISYKYIGIGIGLCSEEGGRLRKVNILINLLFINNIAFISVFEERKSEAAHFNSLSAKLSFLGLSISNYTS